MYFTTEQLLTTSQKEDYKQLLEQSNLTYEETKLQLGVYDKNKLIGGISLDNNCIKLLKVDENYNGLGVSNVLISDILKFAYEQNIFHLFVYTKPENEELFLAQGFYQIIKTNDVLFLENTKRGITRYCEELEKKVVEAEKICGLVMNLNPITLGHEYLISRASAENDVVHLMIVKEDKSVFPYNIRLELLEKVTKKYDNVVIHEGSDYCISSATFPTYFIKSKEDVPSIYANLDLNIYGTYLAKALKINRRYIGEEPYSKTTNMYNEVMKEVLPTYGIDVVEVKRKEIDADIISASKVRELLKNSETTEEAIEKVAKYVPIETLEFLKSDIGEAIIKKVKENNNRH